jgi:hypothetical protein
VSTRRHFLATLAGAYAAGAFTPRLSAYAFQPAAAALTDLTLLEAAARLRARSVTSVQLTEACLARITRLTRC